MEDRKETLVEQDVAQLRKFGLRRSRADYIALIVVPAIQGISIFLVPFGLGLLVFQLFPQLQYGLPGFLISCPLLVLAIGVTIWSAPAITYRSLRNQALRWRKQNQKESTQPFVGLGIGRGFAWDGLDVSVDYGLLEMRDERLCFQGSQVQFVLPVGQIRDVEVRSVKAFGMPLTRLFVAWGTDDREEWISFDFRDVHSAHEQRAKSDEFAAHLREVIRPSRSIVQLTDADLPIRASSLLKRPTPSRQELGKALVLAILAWIPTLVLLMILVLWLHAPTWIVLTLQFPLLFVYWLVFLGRIRKKNGRLNDDG